MILMAVFIFLSLLSVIWPRSNKVFVCLVVFTWFVAAFCTQHADYATYYTRYMNYERLSSLTEVGFTWIMILFHKLSFSFDLFLCIAYAFTIGTVAWFIRKHSPNYTICFALYSIFPYCIDSVQLRNTMAFCVFLIGLNSLLKEDETLKIRRVIFFVISVIIASFIHFSAILFLLVLIPYFLDIRKITIVTAIVTGILMLVGNVDLLTKVATLFVSSSKMDSVLDRITKYGVHSIHSIQLAMIIPTALILLFIFSSQYNLRLEEKYGTNLQRTIEVQNNLDIFLKIQIVALCILPIVPFILDVYRIHRYLLILGYIAATSYNTERCKRRLINTTFFYVILMLTVWLIFYIQIYRLNSYEGTFFALFHNNKFIH